VAALTGHGDPQVQELLPATVPADRVSLVGLHAWAEDDIANVAQWGIGSFSPDHLRRSTQPLLDWLAATGCARVAIHFDVDAIDSNELVLGLGAEPGGLTTAQVRRIVEDLDAMADVVGITVAEFIPRQFMHLQQLLTTFPLLRMSRSGSASGIAQPRQRPHRDRGDPGPDAPQPAAVANSTSHATGRGGRSMPRIPLRRVRAGEGAGRLSLHLKAGPAGGRLRRPSSAGSDTAVIRSRP